VRSAIDSVLNRLISVSFARQLPRAVLSVGDDRSESIARSPSSAIAVRRDTVAKASAPSSSSFATILFANAKAIRRFAVEQGLAIGAQDMPWRAELESMWGAFARARGMLLLNAARASVASRDVSGFEGRRGLLTSSAFGRRGLRYARGHEHRPDRFAAW